MTWQPIETAPRDGTRVLLAVKNATTDGMRDDITVGWFSSHPPMWVHGASIGPTHWMPLPDLPE